LIILSRTCDEFNDISINRFLKEDIGTEHIYTAAHRPPPIHDDITDDDIHVTSQALVHSSKHDLCYLTVHNIVSTVRSTTITYVGAATY